MNNLLGTLLVKLAMDAAEFGSGMTKAENTLRSAGARMQSVGAGLTAGVTLPLVGAGAAAVAFASDYNASLANIASLGVPTKRITEFKSEIQDLAIEVGKMPRDLSEGMYQVQSAFGDSSDSMAILAINAKAAAAGIATTTEAINLTSAVTKGYGDTSAAAVQQVADLAFQTVALGQTTFPELASSMGRVVPLAASLGVAQKELFAVMATGSGVTGTASEVSTQLRGVLQSLMAPTKGMEKLLSQLGFASGQAMLEQLGLQGTIEAVVQAAQDSGTPLQDFIGSIEGQTLAMALAGPQAATFTEKLATMGDVSGAVDDAFAAQTSGINKTGFTMAQVSVKAAVLAQRIGDGIAPALGKLLDMATPFVDKLIEMADWFASADANTQGLIVGIAAVAAVIGPVLGIVGMFVSALSGLGAISGVVSAAVSALGAVIAVLGWPIALVIAAIAGLVVAWNTDFLGLRTMILGWIDDIVAAWPQFVVDVGTAWDSLLDWLGQIWTNITTGWTGTIDAITGAWAAFTAWLPTDMASLQEAAGAAWSALTGFLANVWQSTIDGLQSAWNWFTGWLPGGMADAQAASESGWSQFTGWVGDTWSGAVDGLQSAWISFADWLPVNADEMRQRTQQIFEMIGAGIEGAFDGALNATKGLWQRFASFLGTDTETLNSIVVQAMRNTAQQISDGWNNATGAVRSAWETLSGWFGGAVQAMVDTVSTIWGTFTTTIIKAWQGALDSLRSAWDGFASALGTAVQGMADTVGGAWERTTGWIGRIWSGGTDDMADTAEALNAALGGSTSALAAALSGQWNELGEDVRGTQAETVLQLSAQWAEFTGAMAQLATERLDAVETTWRAWGLQLRVDLMNTVTPLQTSWSDGLRALNATAIGHLSTLFGTFHTLASALPRSFSDVNWIQVGVGIVDGIVAGINSASDRLLATMRQLALDALRAAKDALEISSPSRRAATEIGSPFVQGIAVGALGAIGAAEGALQMGLDRLVAGLGMEAIQLDALSGFSPDKRTLSVQVPDITPMPAFSGMPLEFGNYGENAPVTITLMQNFYGAVDTQTVGQASENAVIAAMRRIGAR